MEIPEKNKNRTTIFQHYPKEYAPGYNSQLYTHVYCSTSHNSQAMEAAKIPQD
jgi:hypothetical protein